MEAAGAADGELVARLVRTSASRAPRKRPATAAEAVRGVSAARTTRIGVVADTHVGEFLPALPPAVCEALEGCDLVLHAGDLSVPGVLDDLEGRWSWCAATTTVSAGSRCPRPSSWR